MTDVFLSYASQDRAKAEQLSAVLTAAGFSVWWDRHIVIGEAYDHAIERQLESAKSVVVLWSASSVMSEWVRNEADVAAERGVLLPAMIDRVKLPLEFRRKQTADLSSWNGETSHQGFQALLTGIATTVGRPVSDPIPIPSVPKVRRASALLVPLIITAFALGLYALLREHQEKEAALETNAAVEQLAVQDVTANAQASGDEVGLADLAVGRYFGAVMADSKGPSRNGVTVTLTRIDAITIRATSDYDRIQPVEIELEGVGDQLFAAGGNSVFILDLSQTPPLLSFNPLGELAYSGSKLETP